jgi:hypothetical protein
MLNLFEKAIIKVKTIAWTTEDSKYNTEYWDKLVCDSGGIAYCVPDGRYMSYVINNFTCNEIDFSSEQFLQEVAMDRFSATKSANLESPEPDKHKYLAELKNSGFTVDEIIRLKKEGVL